MMAEEKTISDQAAKGGWDDPPRKDYMHLSTVSFLEQECLTLCPRKDPSHQRVLLPATCQRQTHDFGAEV
jgi:hypothetical protein